MIIRARLNVIKCDKTQTRLDIQIWSVAIFEIIMVGRWLVASDIVEDHALKLGWGVELSTSAEAYVRSILSPDDGELPSAIVARETMPDVEDWPLES